MAGLASAHTVHAWRTVCEGRGRRSSVDGKPGGRGGAGQWERSTNAAARHPWTHPWMHRRILHNYLCSPPPVSSWCRHQVRADQPSLETIGGPIASRNPLFEISKTHFSATKRSQRRRCPPATSSQVHKSMITVRLRHSAHRRLRRERTALAANVTVAACCPSPAYIDLGPGCPRLEVSLVQILRNNDHDHDHCKARQDTTSNTTTKQYERQTAGTFPIGS